MKKKRGVIIFLIIVLVIALGVVFFTFKFNNPCTTKACFEDALSSCKKASFVDESEEAVWKYSIYGENVFWKEIRKILSIEKETCLVNVKLLQIKKGDLELEKGQGLDMDCSLPYGVVVSPQADTTRCHGELREFLQEQIIQRLHKYIVDNLGEISSELTDVV